MLLGIAGGIWRRLATGRWRSLLLATTARRVKKNEPNGKKKLMSKKLPASLAAIKDAEEEVVKPARRKQLDIYSSFIMRSHAKCQMLSAK